MRRAYQTTLPTTLTGSAWTLYGLCAFVDPDGNVFKPMWMDMSAKPAG